MWAHNKKDQVLLAALFSGWGGDPSRSRFDTRLTLSRGDHYMTLENNELTITRGLARLPATVAVTMIKEIKIDPQEPFILQNVGPGRHQFNLKHPELGLQKPLDDGCKLSTFLFLRRVHTKIKRFENDFGGPPCATELRLLIRENFTGPNGKPLSDHKATKVIKDGIGRFWNPHQADRKTFYVPVKELPNAQEGQ